MTPNYRFKKSIVGKKYILLHSFNIKRKSRNKYFNTVKIGDQCTLACSIIFETVEGIVDIGDRVFIGNSKLICSNRIEFGSDILVAWGTCFYDHDSHSLSFEDRKNDIQQVWLDYHTYSGNYLKNKDWSTVNSAPIVIKDNVWIGMEALILKGVTIGEGAIVAARSVVTKDVLPYSLVAGNPAKFIKYIDKI